MENNEAFEKIYEECQCAGSGEGSGSIASFAPENMRGLFTAGSGGGYGLATGGGKLLTNKKGDLYTGTGLKYAKRKLVPLKDQLKMFEEIYEKSLKEELN